MLNAPTLDKPITKMDAGCRKKKHRPPHFNTIVLTLPDILFVTMRSYVESYVKNFTEENI